MADSPVRTFTLLQNTSKQSARIGLTGTAAAGACIGDTVPASVDNGRAPPGVLLELLEAPTKRSWASGNVETESPTAPPKDDDGRAVIRVTGSLAWSCMAGLAYVTSIAACRVSKVVNGFGGFRACVERESVSICVVQSVAIMLLSTAPVIDR
jgi:hypothetical protein